MRKIKTIDDITKDGKVEFGEGYELWAPPRRPTPS